MTKGLCVPDLCPSLTYPNLSKAHGATQARDMQRRQVCLPTGKSLFSFLKGEEETAMQREV